MRPKSNKLESDSAVANFINKQITLRFEKVSQGEIAEACGYPYNRANNVSMWRSGKSKLPIERAVRLAEFIKVSPSELVLMCFNEYHEHSSKALDDIGILPHNTKEVDAVTELLKSMRSK